MQIPRRGEIAAYVAKQCDIPFGDEQKKIGRMQEGRAHPETANEVAKLVVKRINQLINRHDESSPADQVEKKLGRFSYRIIANEAAEGVLLIQAKACPKLSSSAASMIDWARDRCAMRPNYLSATL